MQTSPLIYLEGLHKEIKELAEAWKIHSADSSVFSTVAVPAAS